MQRLPLLAIVVPLLLGPASAISCRWDVVGTARSLVSHQCLRLSVKKCDCSHGIGCPGRKYYKVEALHRWTSCSATITWCDWGNWNHDIRTISGSSSCARYSIRKRECCIDDRGTKLPSMALDSRYWTCIGQRSGGDKQTSVKNVPCPGYSTATMPLIFFAIVVVLLIVTTVVIILRIFCRSKLALCWRRTTSVMAPNRSQNPPPPPVMSAAAPPRYEDAMAQMPAPPSYDEAVVNHGHSNVALEGDASSADDQGGVTTAPKPTDPPNSAAEPPAAAVAESTASAEVERPVERSEESADC